MMNTDGGQIALHLLLLSREPQWRQRDCRLREPDSATLKPVCSWRAFSVLNGEVGGARANSDGDQY